MKWSYRIARVSGIDIRVHATFVLIVLLGALEWGAPHGVAGAVFGALTVCTLFFCVALHELGHSLVAQRVGVSVREIVLLPIGGLARLAREPDKPLHELFIAVAGPLVNVSIAAALGAVALLFVGARPDSASLLIESVSRGPSALALLGLLLMANLALAILNMIPALPMDGGRVFRALLALFLGRARATDIAALVGQLLAVALAVYAFRSGNLLLAVFAAFIFLGAGQERMMARATKLLASVRAAEACSRAPALSPDDTLARALSELRVPLAQLPVVHEAALVGVLTRHDAVSAAKRSSPTTPVSAVMRRDFEHVAADMSLEDVRARLIETGGRPIAVRDADGLVGLLSFEDLARVTALAASLERRRAKSPARWPASFG
jgi:Zn-dependent protease